MQPGSDYIMTPRDLKEGLRRKKSPRSQKKILTKLLDHGRRERRSKNFPKPENSSRIQRNLPEGHCRNQWEDSSRNLPKRTTPETIITTTSYSQTRTSTRTRTLTRTRTTVK